MPESCIDYRRQGDTCHFLSLKKRYTYYKSYKKITESSVIVITALLFSCTVFGNSANYVIASLFL